MRRYLRESVNNTNIVDWVKVIGSIIAFVGACTLAYTQINDNTVGLVEMDKKYAERITSIEAEFKEEIENMEEDVGATDKAVQTIQTSTAVIQTDIAHMKDDIESLKEGNKEILQILRSQ